jgi:hypothetical protein
MLSELRVACEMYFEEGRQGTLNSSEFNRAYKIDSVIKAVLCEQCWLLPGCSYTGESMFATVRVR